MSKDKLKILLVKVPEINFEEKKINYAEVLSLKAPPIPLGLASLSAYLKRESNHEVHLFDISAEGFQVYKESQNREVLRKLIEEKIAAVKPDVIGISALMIIDYRWVHYIAGVAKNIYPGVKILVGGGYASLMPERVLEDANIDFVIIGEGEEALLTILNEDFANERLTHLEGIGFRDESMRKIVNRKLSFVENPDTLPFFDWEGVKLENYLRNTNGTLSYITSRGCPLGCSFCSTYLMWGKRFRPLSANRVVDEIDYLISKYPIKHIEFRDDNLTLNKKRTLDIFNSFIERKYNIEWSCPNAIAIITLDREVLEVIKRSGCNKITIGIESGSERVIKNIIHKPVNKDKVREIVKIAKDIGLKVHTAFIVGFPDETREDIEETRDFILELQCDWNQISIATPFPGTEMYEICEKNNYFVNSEIDLDRFRYGLANIRTESFDEKWIKEKAYDINIEVNFIKNYNLKDDPKYAIIEFRSVLSNYPKHLIALFCLTYAYKKAGEKENAQKTFKRACNLIKEEIDIYETYKKYIEPKNPIFEDYFNLVEERDNELPLLQR